MALKIGQINVGRSLSAMTELERIVTEENLDIICLREPYWRPRYKSRLGTPLCVPEEDEVWATCYIINRRINCILLCELSNAKLLALKIHANGLEFIPINAYFKHNEPIDIYLNQLDIILHTLPQSKILIMVDANAKSPIWFNEGTDLRGSLLEDAVMAHDGKL